MPRSGKGLGKAPKRASADPGASAPAARGRPPGGLWAACGVGLLGVLCTANTCSCGFVLDDGPAVLSNPDVVASAPIRELWQHDYWGLEVAHPMSHKSYRPLTVLSFRAQYALHGAQPGPFHALNAVLHGAVCATFHALLRRTGLLRPSAAAFAGVLFAVIPVHCDAVASVVGRAELLSALLYLAALHAFAGGGSGVARAAAAGALAAAATLCKEQGVTALGVAAVYELLCRRAEGHARSWLQPLPALSVLAAALAAILWARFRVMGGAPPKFSEELNPVPALPSALQRALTLHFLAARHVTLIFQRAGFAPFWEVDPLRTAGDARVLLPLAVYAAGAAAAAPPARALLGGGRERGLPAALGLAGAMLWLPLLPATGLLFPVGFVLAERALYLPSMGACFFAGIAADRALSSAGAGTAGRGRRALVAAACAALLCLYATATFSRNQQWASEVTLYEAGVAEHPLHSKMHGTLAQARLRAAEAGAKDETLLRSAAALAQRATELRQQQGRAPLETDYLTQGVALERLGDEDGAEGAYRAAVACAQNVGAIEAEGDGLGAPDGDDVDATVLTSDVGALARSLHHLARILFRRGERLEAQGRGAEAKGLREEMLAKNRAALRLSAKTSGSHSWALAYHQEHREAAGAMRLDALLHTAIAQRRLRRQGPWRRACADFAAEHQARFGKAPEHPGVAAVCGAEQWERPLGPVPVS